MNITLIICLTIIISIIIICLTYTHLVILKTAFSVEDEPTEEIYEYKGVKYILIDRSTLNKDKESRNWRQVAYYCNEERTLYFTRDYEEFFNRFTKINKNGN